MLRTLVIVAALVLVFLIIKNRLNSRTIQQKKTGPASPGPKKSDDMVKCLQCKTYIPRKEAIITGTESFCCKQHQRNWEQDHKNRD